MIELRHLRYFLEVARLQHVTRAAESLHVTQSTLSHQLKQLEDLVGAALFDRVGRGLRLTEAGETFVAYASRAVLEVEEGQVAIEELHTLVRGRLRLGVIHTYNATLLPAVIASFGAAHPEVRITVEDLPASQIEREVAEGGLDLGLAFAPAQREDVTAEALFSERLVLVVGRDHPLARAREVAAERLRSLELAVQTPRFSSRRLIDAALSPWIERSIRLQMSSIEAMLQTIRMRGIGALVFERAVRADPDLVAVPVVRPALRRRAALVWYARRTRSAAARRMADAIREACSEFESA